MTNEVVLRDGIVGSKYWGATAYGDQAIRMLSAFSHELESSWLGPERERSWDALEALLRIKAEVEAGPVDLATRLSEELDRLKQGPPPSAGR